MCDPHGHAPCTMVRLSTPIYTNTVLHTRSSPPPPPPDDEAIANATRMPPRSGPSGDGDSPPPRASRGSRSCGRSTRAPPGRPAARLPKTRHRANGRDAPNARRSRATTAPAADARRTAKPCVLESRHCVRSQMAPSPTESGRQERRGERSHRQRTRSRSRSRSSSSRSVTKRDQFGGPVCRSA